MFGYKTVVYALATISLEYFSPDSCLPAARSAAIPRERLSNAYNPMSDCRKDNCNAEMLSGIGIVRTLIYEDCFAEKPDFRLAPGGVAVAPGSHLGDRSPLMKLTSEEELLSTIMQTALPVPPEHFKKAVWNYQNRINSLS